jgi:predicted dehydrogenase
MIVVVGTGSAGRRHLANLLALGRTDLLVVSEHHRHGSVRAADVSVPAVARLGDALARGPEAVVVANPTARHAATARAAISAGAHVYLEKPAATTASDVATLARAAEAAGVVVAVGQQLRFHPLVAELRARLDGGAVGAVLEVRAEQGEHVADYHPGEDWRASYTTRRELGGGVLLTQIHQLDLLWWLFGPFRAAAAVAGDGSRLGIDVEDAVTYLLRSGTGVPVVGHVDYHQRPKRWTLTVTGTDGRLHLDLQAQVLTWTSAVAGAPIERVEEPVERNDLFVAALADFLAAIGAGSAPAPACPLDQAVEVLAVADAVREAWSSGTVVDVGGSAGG